MPVIDNETLGYAAAVCVALTFCTRSMLKLRMFAIASNVFFITYAVGANLSPILVLHAFLLPINILFLIEAVRLRRQRADAALRLGCLSDERGERALSATAEIRPSTLPQPQR